MTKRAAAYLGLSVLALGLGTGSLLLLFEPSGDPGDFGRSGSSEGGAWAAQKNPRGLSTRERIDRLVRAKSPDARWKLISMYVEWANDGERSADRRALVREIVRMEDRRTAIDVLLMAVGRDPTPLQSDHQLLPMAEELVPLWGSEAHFAEGRDLLRLAQNDKARVVLATSLTERAVGKRGADLPALASSERYELASDLIQVHLQAGNPVLEGRLLEQVRALGGEDLAEVLADPANAHRSRAALRAEQTAVETAASVPRGR